MFGLDSDGLTKHALDEPDYPDLVPGRVLHIDGDFLAYQVAADDSKSIHTMMHNHDVAVETLRLLAGAESTVSHITASHGDKGKRYELAIQKEYQGNRKNKQKPKHLHTIKSWMERKRGAISHVNQEADDGLSQANWQAIQAGTPDLSVLVSKDKDLQICQGWHLDWDTGDLEFIDGYGYIELDRSKSSPKIVGKGNAFFWAQMLTGDTADNIQGLPKLSSKDAVVYKPSAAVKKAKGKKKLADRIKMQKPVACGPVLVYDILKDINCSADAFVLVKQLYENTGKQLGFKHWDTDKTVKWNKVFLSEAQLLWMRRDPHENDVIRYFKECMNDD